MKIQIQGAFDIPDILASLVVGAKLDQAFCDSDFVITMDENGAKRFSSILFYMYADYEKWQAYRDEVNKQTLKALTAKSANKQKVEMPESIPTPEPVATPEAKVTGGVSMSALKNKSKKFLGNGG